MVRAFRSLPEIAPHCLHHLSLRLVDAIIDDYEVAMASHRFLMGIVVSRNISHNGELKSYSGASD